MCSSAIWSSNSISPRTIGLTFRCGILDIQNFSIHSPILRQFFFSKFQLKNLYSFVHFVISSNEIHLHIPHFHIQISMVDFLNASHLLLFFSRRAVPANQVRYMQFWPRWTTAPTSATICRTSEASSRWVCFSSDFSFPISCFQILLKRSLTVGNPMEDTDLAPETIESIIPEYVTTKGARVSMLTAIPLVNRFVRIFCVLKSTKMNNSVSAIWKCRATSQVNRKASTSFFEPFIFALLLQIANFKLHFVSIDISLFPIQVFQFENLLNLQSSKKSINLNTLGTAPNCLLMCSLDWRPKSRSFRTIVERFGPSSHCRSILLTRW